MTVRGCVAGIAKKGGAMKLKQITMVVLICFGISLLWQIAGLLLPPGILQGIYRSRMPQLLYLVRDISLFLFFLVLFTNQK